MTQIYRHAALMAISASGEGCHKQMEPYLSQVMDGVINFIQDPHPRYYIYGALPEPGHGRPRYLLLNSIYIFIIKLN